MNPGEVSGEEKAMAATKGHPEEMAAEIVTITPELAGDWLARNTHNRPLRDHHVQWLAKQMEAGEWVLNGESIKFNSQGALVDGQHRLASVIMSNVTIKSVVVHHAPMTAFETIDTGKRRSAADALALTGEINCLQLAAILSNLYHYEKRQMVGFRLAPSAHQVLALLEANPECRDAAKLANRVTNKVQSPPSVIGLVWYLTSRIDREAADKFFDTLATGANIGLTDPIYKLRERFIANRESRQKISHIEMIALTIKAWNNWRVGRETNMLVWRYRGGEGFPVPQ